MRQAGSLGCLVGPHKQCYGGRGPARPVRMVMKPSALLCIVGLAVASGCNCGQPQTRRTHSQIASQPSSIDFGTTAPGSQVTRALEIDNLGDGPLLISALEISGDNASFFSVTDPDPAGLGAGSHVTVSVSYSPTSEGSHWARLTIHSDANNAPELVVSLTGAAASCLNVPCNAPPGPCFEATGLCSSGTCSYPAKADGTSCDDGDACTQTDTCGAGRCRGTPTACVNPPAAACSGANSFTSYPSPGVCSVGACSYPPVEQTCAGGCTNGVCLPDPCQGVTCNQAPQCFKAGTCVGGSCQYQIDVGAGCDDGDGCTTADVCGAGGACAGTPKTCPTAPAPNCASATARRIYTAPGACIAGGACSYAFQDVACATGQQCLAATGQCECTQGHHVCAGQCVSDDDPASCGATSCTPCPAAPTHGTPACAGGTCGFTCDPGYQDCGGSCCQAPNRCPVQDTLILPGTYEKTCDTLAGTCQLLTGATDYYKASSPITGGVINFAQFSLAPVPSGRTVKDALFLVQSSNGTNNMSSGGQLTTPSGPVNASLNTIPAQDKFISRFWQGGSSTAGYYGLTPWCFGCAAWIQTGGETTESTQTLLSLVNGWLTGAPNNGVAFQFWSGQATSTLGSPPLTLVLCLNP